MSEKKREGSSQKECPGLKRLRNAGGDLVRPANPAWGRPNKKAAKRLAARQKAFDSMGSHNSSGGHLMHRPGSWRKPL